MSVRELDPSHWEPAPELQEPALAPPAARVAAGLYGRCSACGGRHEGERPLRDRLRCIAGKMRWAERRGPVSRLGEVP